MTRAEALSIALDYFRQGDEGEAVVSDHLEAMAREHAEMVKLLQEAGPLIRRLLAERAALDRLIDEARLVLDKMCEDPDIPEWLITIRTLLARVA
jgi:hypothetical protein